MESIKQNVVQSLQNQIPPDTSRLLQVFLYLNLFLIFILVCTRFFSEDSIEGIGILIFYTPILPFYILQLVILIALLFKQRNPLVKSGVKLLLTANLLYLLLLALDIANISDSIRDLALVLPHNIFFVIYLIGLSGAGVFASLKFDLALSTRLLMGSTAGLLLIYGIFLAYINIMGVGIYGEKLLAPDGAESIFYVNSEGYVYISYQKECSWCKTDPNDMHSSDFTVLGKNIGKTSDTVLFSDISGGSQAGEYLNLSHLDAETFEIFEEHPTIYKGYSKDKNSVYYGLVHEVRYADPQSFREFTNVPQSILVAAKESIFYHNPWYRDDQHIYYEGHRVEYADPETFVVTSNYDANDSNYFYSTLGAKSGVKHCSSRICGNIDIRKTEMKESPDNIQPGWEVVSIAELGIEFMYPVGWEVSDVYDGDFDGVLLDQVRVRPTEGDKTPVWFFAAEASLEEVLSLNLLKIDLKVRESQKKEILLDDKPAIKRETVYEDSSCEYIEYFLEDTSTVYGAQIVKCPTNTVEHYGPRVTIAESMTVLGDAKKTVPDSFSDIEPDIPITQTLQGWKKSSVDELGVSFSHPTDWNVSEVSTKITEDGVELKHLRVYPEETDPTVVWFFAADELVSNIRDIKILNSNTDGSIFEDITVNGSRALRRIDAFTNNDCTKTVTLIEYSDKTYGSEIVECPTHPEGYDQIRIDIANSLSV